MARITGWFDLSWKYSLMITHVGVIPCFNFSFDSSIYHYIPWYTMIYHYIPLYTIIYHYIPLYTIIYHYIPLYTIIYHYIPFVLTAFHRTCVLCGVFGSEDRGSRAGWNSRRWVYRISGRELEKLRGQNGRQLDGTWRGATLDVTNFSPGYVLSFVDIVRASGRSKCLNWHQMG